MSKTYRDWSTGQAYLFPPSPHDWLPEGDLVHFLLDTVATLDLTPIFAHYERELRGQPPFHPRDDGGTAPVLLRHRHAVLAADHDAVPR